MASICLDVSTAPLPNAVDFIEAPRAPGNWKDQTKIEAWIEEKKAERLADAGLDLDLCQITGVGWRMGSEAGALVTRGDEAIERTIVARVAQWLKDGHALVTFNGRAFDVPVLKRRARYLGLWFPDISTDRYRSPVVDLLALLSDHDPQRRRSLTFYCKRLGWTDLCEKPLDGRDEANVLVSGEWDKLADSLTRDVEAITRLAQWAGVL